MDAKGGSWGGMAWEIGIDINTLCIKQVTSENFTVYANSTPVLLGDLHGKEVQKDEVCVNT